jgi:hypothetical protein
MVDLENDEFEELREKVKKLRKLRKKLKKSLPRHMGADEFFAIESQKMPEAETAYWLLHLKICPICQATYFETLDDNLEFEETSPSNNQLNEFGLDPKELKEIMASC